MSPARFRNIATSSTERLTAGSGVGNDDQQSALQATKDFCGRVRGHGVGGAAGTGSVFDFQVERSQTIVDCHGAQPQTAGYTGSGCTRAECA